MANVSACQPTAKLFRRGPNSNRWSVTRVRCVSAPHVAVAGTTGTGPAGDIAAQARDALRRIEVALGQAGAALTDVVRTRIYVTDISRWREVGAVHAHVFGEVRPAATMVEVSALITPEILVEIEADAYLDPGAES